MTDAVAGKEPAPDPWHVVDVQALDARTVDLVIGRVEVSHQADHLVYRESEIDALWSLADMAVQERRPEAQAWLDLLWLAHDQIADGDRPAALEALARLRDALPS